MGLRDTVVHAGEPEVSRDGMGRGGGGRDGAPRWVGRSVGNGCAFFFFFPQEEEEEELVVRRGAGPGGPGPPLPGELAGLGGGGGGEARSLCRDSLLPGEAI